MYTHSTTSYLYMQYLDPLLRADWQAFSAQKEFSGTMDRASHVENGRTSATATDAAVGLSVFPAINANANVRKIFARKEFRLVTVLVRRVNQTAWSVKNALQERERKLKGQTEVKTAVLTIPDGIAVNAHTQMYVKRNRTTMCKRTNT